MKRPNIPVLEAELDDELVDGGVLSPSDLGLSYDMLGSELEDDDDDLGLRDLYEHPEHLVRPRRWPHAA